jgi:hypothetical protein|uniref:Uncharacterized protein n=1 Tax=viral metagenome TaxID=1070528 RepID=A0A6C0IRB8_9ZZZZ
MLSENQSIRYFIFGCIPMRILLTLLPLYLRTSWLFYYGLVLFTIASSFLYLYFANSRLNAFEAGGNTWWANFRLLHGLLYMGAAIYSLQGQSIAWLPLFIDTLLGFGLFVHKHFGYLSI